MIKGRIAKTVGSIPDGKDTIHGRGTKCGKLNITFVSYAAQNMQNSVNARYAKILISSRNG